ncbi:metalloregulator ArsR/SmtB family transcription factor [Rummeliibacillus sp. SL167]|uniref:helix-turn-helix transcriptional regulator n=1 Tax=Rummeliibacillus sp. SL167 TaxID=2579792 RepID=UPI0011B564FB|nr:helix-turn-helix domain-containing protein [Rummeliibacillus sp. SL167]
MLNPLKVTSTLSDETRFSIYQFILQEKKSFSVQEIAEKFQIHPNVARLHLTKLTEIEVVNSEYEKTGKGGRPGRRYKANENGITISFPKRNYEELLEWTLEIINEIGEPANQIGKKISYKKGIKDMDQLILSHGKDKLQLTFEEKVEFMTEAASLIGYVPLIKNTPDGRTISFAVYNCPYHDKIGQHASIICDLHESYLKGQFDALFDVKDFVQIESMTNNCDYCTYRINI